QGFTLDLHESIWVMFCDYHRSRQTTSASWSSEFRNWLKNKIHYGQLVPNSGATPTAMREAMGQGATQTSSRTPADTRFSFSRNPTAAGPASRSAALEASATTRLEAARRATQALRERQGKQA